MSFFRKLFGSAADKGEGKATGALPSVEAEETYEGYHIAATPLPEGAQYRLAATITRDIEGDRREHRLIRADMFPDKADAAAFALRKARQMIDEQGDGLFET